MIAIEGQPRGEPRAVRQQRAEPDVFAIFAPPLRNPLSNRLLELKTAAVHQPHHQRRRGNHLGERGEIEDRVLLRERRLRIAIEPAERLLRQNAPVRPHFENGGGKGTVVDAALDDSSRAPEAGHGANAPLATADTYVLSRLS